MLLDRHRVAQLIELSQREQVLSGAAREAGAEDVALFLKAAYDDASGPARTAFMQRIDEKDWPWTAVHSPVPVYMVGLRSAGAPPALGLLLGQAEVADADPGNRLPARGTPLWEPLYKALDVWDTQTIVRTIGPQGWVPPQQASDAPSERPTQPLEPVVSKVPRWLNPRTVLWTTIALTTGIVTYEVLGPTRTRRRLENKLKEETP